MERDFNEHTSIARKFITPLDVEKGMSGKLSYVGYKVGKDMSFLIFSGCQHSVTFKFDPNEAHESLQKLENLKSIIAQFEKDFNNLLK